MSTKDPKTREEAFMWTLMDTGVRYNVKTAKNGR